jgi:hypothetical protein
MHELQGSCVKKIPLQGEFLLGLLGKRPDSQDPRRSIEGVAYDWMAQRREMHADLMCAPSLNGDIK